MNIKEIKQDGLSYDFEIKVPANDIAVMVDQELETVGKTAKIPGFRPGKVPMEVLRQKYGRHVLGDVLEKMVNKSSAEALAKQKITPAMQPKIEVKEFDEGKDLVYKMAVEKLPEFKVTDLTKLSVVKPVTEVDKKVIDEALENIANQNKSFKETDTKRATKKGDTVKIDFHGKRADGVEFDGMHGHDHNLELGAGQFIPGFEDQLIGKKPGDKVEVKVKFPDQYQMPDLAGQDAIFDVDVKAIMEAEKTKIDDELAKSLGLDSLDKLKEAITQQYESEYGQYTRMKLKKSLLDELDRTHDFELPQMMVSQEHDHIVQQLEREQSQGQGQGQGQGAGEGEKPAEMSDKEKKELRPLAERRVRLGLVLSEIGKSKKVEVSQQELQQAVIAEARKYPGQEKEVFDFYSKNPQVVESLKAPIFEDKVVDIILEQAKVTETKVSLEELMAEDDDIPTAAKTKKKAPAKKAAKKKA